MDILIGLGAAMALIAANAFFVADEFCLVAVDRAELESDAAAGSASAQRTLGLTSRLSFHLSAAQLGITISSLLLGFAAEPTMEKILHAIFGGSISPGISVALAIFIASAVQMVIGELVPKSIAIAAAAPTAARLGPMMVLYGVVSRPFVDLLNNTANAVIRRFGVEPKEELDTTPSRDELAMMIRSSGELGALAPDEVDLLTRSIRFGEKTAADALIPRVEVLSLAVDQSVGDLVDLSVASGHSRFPVYGDNADDVRGVVHIKDVYAVDPDRRRNAPLTEVMVDAMAVPETRELDLLLPDMQENRIHMAIVIDEHGGTAGIITIEDLVEEIVGEIDDEHDEHDEHVAMTRVESTGSTVLSAALHPDEVREACGFEVPDGPYETLAGFVLHRLGHIPRPGERFDFDGWRIEVVAMERRRIVTARLVAPRTVAS